jgi:two-component system chemotaxis sensor kinase CheA
MSFPLPSNEPIAEASPELGARLTRLDELVSRAGADDLRELAEIHTGLEEVSRELSALGAHAALPALALRGAELAGKVILQECGDGGAAVREIAAVVAALRGGGAAKRGEVATPRVETSESPVAETSAGGEALQDIDSIEDPIEAEVLMSADDLPLVQEFVTEATSHLDAAEAKLLALEHDPDDKDAVNAVFRGFHTIKGVAGFLNLKQIGALAHVAENLLDLARRGKLEVRGATADLVLEATDTMRLLVSSVTTAVERGAPVEARPSLPSLIARLKRAARGSPSADDVQVGRPPRAPASPASAEHVPSAVLPAEEERRTGERRGAESGGDGTVKVATGRLDNLINMVGEMVIAQSMVSQDVAGAAAGNHRLGRNLSRLGKITRELQDLSMAMRMVPVQGVFQKMTRVVRDLGQKAGKQIELSIAGGDTEVDRNVVEAIGDPLVHMVRNSADHGIEPAEERVRLGKPPAGRLELRAEHLAGSIRIQVADDGRGLNRAKILKKAIDAGIVREGQELTDQEICRLIFHAGLSTAEKLSDISGRGVGMDVVKRNIEALRGRIEIASVEGKGTTFSIWLPLTLAVIDGMLVRVGDHRYILPINSIDRSLRPTADQITTVQGRGEICSLRGEILPLFRLYELFDVQPRSKVPCEALVVVARDNDRRCGLLVDEILGQQQVVIKSLGDGIGTVAGVSGGAILGDGNVCLILDVPGILDLAQNRARPAGATPPAPAALVA